MPKRGAAMTARVLIIDDDPDLLAMMVAAFEGCGFETHSAANGYLGVKLFEAIDPDLVVTDIVMPEKEGIATIIELKRADKAPLVIAISGGGRFGGPSFLTWATHLGADAVIPKPFRMSTLVAKARELLGEPIPLGQTDLFDWNSLTLVGGHDMAATAHNAD